MNLNLTQILSYKSFLYSCIPFDKTRRIKRVNPISQVYQESKDKIRPDSRDEGKFPEFEIGTLIDIQA